jgi:hypothetical protein
VEFSTELTLLYDHEIIKSKQNVLNKNLKRAYFFTTLI